MVITLKHKTRTLGLAVIHGTQRVFWNRYDYGWDAGINWIPGRFGLYVWATQEAITQ